MSSVYIKSQSARIGAMGVHARPQSIQQELLKPLILRSGRHFGWRSPLLEQTCHSTRTKAVDQKAVQCHALNETALRPEIIRKGAVRGSLLKASVASTDGISAQANANLVPGGRDFFTCESPFALFLYLWLRPFSIPCFKYVIAYGCAHNPAMMSQSLRWMVDHSGLVDLPWNRVGVWAVVVWFMYSLKDFFGVSCILTGLPCNASFCGARGVSPQVSAQHPELSRVCPDCYGDIHPVLHWERICQIRTEGSAVPASDITPDQAENPGKLTNLTPCDK